MVKGFLNGLMALNIMDNLKIIILKEKAFIIGQMVESMKVNG